MRGAGFGEVVPINWLLREPCWWSSGVVVANRSGDRLGKSEVIDNLMHRRRICGLSTSKSLFG